MLQPVKIWGTVTSWYFMSQVYSFAIGLEHPKCTPYGGIRGLNSAFLREKSMFHSTSPIPLDDPSHVSNMVFDDCSVSLHYRTRGPKSYPI